MKMRVREKLLGSGVVFVKLWLAPSAPAMRVLPGRFGKTALARPLTRVTNRLRPRRARLAAFPLFGVVAALVLQGCGDRKVNRAQVPEFVQRMMDADFPPDGHGHVRVRGRFRIDPTTAFCTFRPGYGLDTEQLNAALRRMGQNPIYEGAYRTHQANISRECIPGRSVFIRAVPTANRQGGPYKLIVAVWQGDAAWTGAIERLNGVRPGFEFRPAVPGRHAPSHALGAKGLRA